jgi:hypothetical protein
MRGMVHSQVVGGCTVLFGHKVVVMFTGSWVMHSDGVTGSKGKRRRQFIIQAIVFLICMRLFVRAAYQLSNSEQQLRTMGFRGTKSLLNTAFHHYCRFET